MLLFTLNLSATETKVYYACPWAVQKAAPSASEGPDPYACRAVTTSVDPYACQSSTAG
jgi:hypothetical protein